MNCLIELCFDQIGSFISFLWFPFYFLVSFLFFFPFHMAYFLLPLSLPFESDKNTCKESCFSFLGCRYFSPSNLILNSRGYDGVYKHIFSFFSWEAVSQAVVWWFSSVFGEFFPASIVCASSCLSMFLEFIMLTLNVCVCVNLLPSNFSKSTFFSLFCLGFRGS